MSRDIKGVRKFMADKTIAVGSAPGGTGKTTNAVNLSMRLALPPFRKRVVLVDLDPTPRQAYFFKKLDYFGFAPFDPEYPLPTFREYFAFTRECLEHQQKTLADAEEALKRAAASSSGNAEETLRNVKQHYAERLNEDSQKRIRLGDCLTSALRFSEGGIDYFRMPRVISAENPLESLLQMGDEPGAAQIITSAYRLLLRDLQALPDVDYLVLDLGGGMYWNVVLPAAISDVFIPIIRYSPSGEDDLDRVYELVVKAQRKRENESSEWGRKQSVEEGKRAEFLKEEEKHNYEVLSRKFHQLRDLVLGTRAGGGKRGVKGLVSLLELNEVQKDPLRKMFALSEQKLKEGKLSYETLEGAFRVCRVADDELREKLKPKQRKQYGNVCAEIRQAISEERHVGYYNAFHELLGASLDVQASQPFSYPFQHIVPLVNLVPSMSLTAPSRARWMLSQFVDRFEEDFGGEGGRRTSTINVIPDDAFLVYNSLLVALSKQKPLVTMPFFLASQNHDDDHQSLFGKLAHLVGRGSAYFQRRQAEQSSFYRSIGSLGEHIVYELGRRKGK